MNKNSHQGRFVVATSVGSRENKPTEVGTTNVSARLRAAQRRRWTLFAKEMRQSTGVIIGMFTVLLIVILASWLFGVSGDTNSSAPWFLLLWWSACSTISMLGSAFLADENRARTTNFLLRLPVSRREVFFTKIKSHAAALAIWCVIAVALMAICTVPAQIDWGFPSQWHPRDFCTAAIWLPVIYFLAVIFSVMLDKSIAAFLAAAATAVGVYAMSTYLGIRCVEWLYLYLPANLRQAEIVSNLVLLLVLVVSALLSWWLFARKEGR